MKHGCFDPDRFDRAVMARGWDVLAVLAARLAAMVACLDGAGRANAARRLCRIGEAMARRLLVARALLAPLPAVSPLTRRAQEALVAAARRRRYSPQDARWTPPAPRRALLRLSEPLAQYSGLSDGPDGAPRGQARSLPPAIRVAQYGVLTVITRSTHGDHSRPPLSICGARIPAALTPAKAQTDETPGLVRRSQALADVVARPGANARRMARWLAREQNRRHGRYGPMRPGRAPGQVTRRRDRDDDQLHLGEVAELARRALAARSARDHAGPDPPASAHPPSPKATGPPP